jgi:hypothetical protein
LELGNALRKVIREAVKNDRPVKLILATDFQTLQTRCEDPRWSAECLRTLVSFLKSNTGKSPNLEVVERSGPYEIQQYIIKTGRRSGEVIESRKLVKPESTYYDADANKDEMKVEEEAKLFDSCFQSFQLSMLEEMLVDSEGVSATFLTKEILNRPDEDVWRDDSKRRDMGRTIAETIAGIGLERSDLEDEASLEARKKKLLQESADLINDVAEAKKYGSESQIKDLLTSEPASLILLVFNDDVLTRAMKEHLIDKWTDESIQLRGERSHNIRIQLLDGKKKPVGVLDKEKFHLALQAVGEGASMAPPRDEQWVNGVQVWNVHVSAFVLSGKADKLILRKCLDMGTPDYPHLDPGKWDRSIAGHARYSGRYVRELTAEIRHHFEGGDWSMDSGELHEFANRKQFRNACSSSQGSPSVPHGKMLVYRLGDPVQGMFPRTRWHRGNGGRPQQEIILEPVIAMPYLCLLPSICSDMRHLPSPVGHSHCSNWLEMSKGQVSELSSSIDQEFSTIEADGHLQPGHWIEIPVDHSMTYLPDEDGSRAETITWEAALLLHLFADEILKCMR